MPQIPIEQYFEKLRNSDPKYHWPLERAEERRPEREAIHKEFPYVITYSGIYGHDGLLDNLQDWCREQFGERDGECQRRECELSYEHWCKEIGFDDALDEALDEIGPRPDKKDRKALKRWDKEYGIIVDDHFKILEERTDAPDKHFHQGKWTSHFVCKIGYDEGFEDYCFKNAEDALYFKIMWEEEAERRG